MKQITLQQREGYSIVNDNKTLAMLNKAGLIVWPVMVNNSKGKRFKYVDNGVGVGDSFEFKGRQFSLKYHSGCFFPYVYEYWTKVR